jgi:hypothetical protein
MPACNSRSAAYQEKNFSKITSAANKATINHCLEQSKQTKTGEKISTKAVEFRAGLFKNTNIQGQGSKIF